MYRSLHLFMGANVMACLLFSRHLEHGQRRPQHQRLSVLRLHRQDLLVGRQARRLRSGRRGNGRRQEGGVLRIPVRQDLGQDRRRRQRPALSNILRFYFSQRATTHPRPPRYYFCFSLKKFNR